MYFRIKDNAVYDYSDVKFDESCVFSGLCTKAEYDEHPNKYMIDDVEEQVKVYEYEKKTVEVPIYNDEGEIIGYDEVEVDDYDKPIMIEDPETGELVHKFHYETVIKRGLVINPDYEQEEAEKEAVRIANLHLTRGDVFRGLLLAKGVTRADIRAKIELMPEDTPQEKVNKEMALIDFEEALEFYRGVALINTIGSQLDISKEQLDRFFDTNDWHELVA